VNYKCVEVTEENYKNSRLYLKLRQVFGVRPVISISVKKMGLSLQFTEIQNI
jgi:hypothetical protein